MSEQNPAHFIKQYMKEIFSIAALIVAGFSAWTTLFFSGTGLMIVFLILGVIGGMFFPNQIHSCMHRCCGKVCSGAPSTILMGCVEIAVALFVPCVYFGWIGVLAGSSCNGGACCNKED